MDHDFIIITSSNLSGQDAVVRKQHRFQGIKAALLNMPLCTSKILMTESDYRSIAIWATKV